MFFQKDIIVLLNYRTIRIIQNNHDDIIYCDASLQRYSYFRKAR